MSETASYLYAITRPVEPAALLSLRGIDDAPIRAVTKDGVACLVSTVDLDEFGEAALKRNLEDLSWVEATARAHDRVVHAACDLVTTAPLRLGTICLDDDAVLRRLRDIAARANDTLARLDDRVEWGVKVFAPSNDSYAEDEPLPAAAGASGDGTAYLVRRRADAARREQAAASTLQDVERVYDELAKLAVAGHRHRPQDARLSRAARPMLLNAAFLVDKAQQANFRSGVEQIAAAREADSVVVTGPWPCYSFATLDVQ